MVYVEFEYELGHDTDNNTAADKQNLLYGLLKVIDD